jgi:hypothetical protein
MKIKFVTPWHTDSTTYSFVNDIWNIDGRYDDVLTHGDDYTHLVFYNEVVDPSRFRIVKENTYGIIESPYWANASDRNILSYCSKVITYEPEHYESGRTIFSPFVGFHRLYDLQNGEIVPTQDTTKKILSRNFEKTKLLSIIVRNHGFDYRTCTNYNNRQSLVVKMMESDLDFDLYGIDWNFRDSRFKGPLVNKIDGLADYKYSIVLENSPVRGEITEKFMDAILCNTIPIYNGHKDVREFYPNCYEYLEYDGNEVETIRRIVNSEKTANDYSFSNAKHLYLNVYNPIKIILDDCAARFR